MSRIGFQTINIPAGVEVKVDGNVVSVKGPKGQLQEKISDLLEVEIKDGVLEVKRSSDNAEDRSQHGLARTLINNMVIGVTEGFQKKLQLVGVGYKPLVYLGYQIVHGVNYFFIAEQTLMTKDMDRRVIKMAINELGANYKILGDSIEVIAE